MDAPDRLLSIIEGDPLFDDEFAVVIFSTLLAVMETRAVGESPRIGAGELLNLAVLGDLLVVSGGGLVVGSVLSAVVFVAGSRVIEDRLAELLLSVFVAYGSVLVAERYRDTLPKRGRGSAPLGPRSAPTFKPAPDERRDE